MEATSKNGQPVSKRLAILGSVPKPAFSLGIDATSRKVRLFYNLIPESTREHCPRQESNPRPYLTRGVLYPLSYWGSSFIRLNPVDSMRLSKIIKWKSTQLSQRDNCPNLLDSPALITFR